MTRSKLRITRDCLDTTPSEIKGCAESAKVNDREVVVFSVVSLKSVHDPAETTAPPNPDHLALKNGHLHQREEKIRLSPSGLLPVAKEPKRHLLGALLLHDDA